MMDQSITRCGMASHLPRILLSFLFVYGGANFVLNFQSTQETVAGGLEPWGLAGIALIATLIAIILKLGGGLMLLLNFKTQYAAWMLIIFTILATLVYHTNWSGADAQMQITQALKNIAIIGGLLLYARCFCKICNGAPAPAESLHSDDTSRA